MAQHCLALMHYNEFSLYRQRRNDLSIIAVVFEGVFTVFYGIYTLNFDTKKKIQNKYISICLEKSMEASMLMLSIWLVSNKERDYLSLTQ